MDPQRQKQRIYLYVIIALLIAGGYMMNSRLHGLWQDDKAQRQKSIEAAEIAALQAQTEGRPRVSVFRVPPDSILPDAPIQLIAYITSDNDCLPINAEVLTQVKDVYGDLLSIDYRDMIYPDIQAEADEKKIGCDAGLFINGQIERKGRPGDLAPICNFRGSLDGSFAWPSDVYGAINYILEEKQIEVPPRARELDQAIAQTGIRQPPPLLGPPPHAAPMR